MISKGGVVILIIVRSWELGVRSGSFIDLKIFIACNCVIVIVNRHESASKMSETR